MYKTELRTAERKLGFLSDVWRTLRGKPTKSEERAIAAQKEEQRKRKAQAGYNRGVANESRSKRKYSRSSSNEYLG